MRAYGKRRSRPEEEMNEREAAKAGMEKEGGVLAVYVWRWDGRQM